MMKTPSGLLGPVEIRFDQPSELCFKRVLKFVANYIRHYVNLSKLTWLVLGEDPAVRSHMAEKLTAL